MRPPMRIEDINGESTLVGGKIVFQASFVPQCCVELNMHLYQLGIE
jgi:hypothetical protein